MKRILGISGSMKKNEFSSTEFLLDRALEKAASLGFETKHVRLVDYNILPCTGCGSCMDNRNCKLLSRPEDQMAELYEECCRADAFIFASPVYALSLPAIWKNWIDRCEPCEDSDLEYEYYNYDVVKTVKGKAFRGKVAAQMYIAAGCGSEWALSALAPAFTAIQLSIVANVGITLAEFDAQPGVKRQKWSRPIEEAEFAIKMAECVGERVCETIGYSTYDVEAPYYHRLEQKKDFGQSFFENGLGERVMVNELGTGKIALICAKKEHAETARKWYQALIQKSPKAVENIFSVTLVGQLPHFISQDDIRKMLLSNFEEKAYKNVLFDWNLQVFSSFFSYDGTCPSVIVFDTGSGQILCEKKCMPEENAIGEVSGLLEDTVITDEMLCVNGVNLSVRKVGNGFPTIMVHGNRDCKETLMKLALSLEQTVGGQYILLDLRGHGESEKVKSGYTIDQFAEDVFGVMEKLGISKANYIGHSLGSTVGIRFAAKHGDRLERLVLLSAAATFQIGFKRPEFSREQFAEQLKETNSRAAEFFFSKEFPQIAEQITGHWLEVDYDVHMQMIKMKHPDLSEEAKSIKNKTLIITGRQDAATTPENAKELAALIDGSCMEIVPGSHYMFLEYPVLLRDKIGGFLQ